MTLPDFANRIAALPDGGFLSADNRLDYGYIYSLIHTASAQAKSNWYIKTKKISPHWWLPYYNDFDKLQQIDGCYYRFKLPQLITLDPRNIGMEYVGSLQKNNQFRIVVGRAKFSAMQRDRIMKMRIGITYVLIDNGFCEVYGSVRNFFMNGLWFDPTELPNYNLEKDNYPIDAGLIPEIERIILQLNLNIITRSAQDVNPNFKDDSALVAR